MPNLPPVAIRTFTEIGYLTCLTRLAISAPLFGHCLQPIHQLPLLQNLKMQIKSRIPESDYELCPLVAGQNITRLRLSCAHLHRPREYGAYLVSLCLSKSTVRPSQFPPQKAILPVPFPLILPLQNEHPSSRLKCLRSLEFTPTCFD